MPPRDVFWTPGAVAGLGKLLDRRNDRVGVAGCVNDFILRIAADVSLTTVIEGPQEFQVARFQCKDGDTDLFLQAVFQAPAANSLTVIDIRSTQF